MLLFLLVIGLPRLAAGPPFTAVAVTVAALLAIRVLVAVRRARTERRPKGRQAACTAKASAV